MNILKLLFFTVCAISLVQCTEKLPPSANTPKPTVFQHQHALNKAKKVNQTIQDSAKRQRKAIDSIE